MFYWNTFQERISKDPSSKYRWPSIRTTMVVRVEYVAVAVVVAAWIEEGVEEEGTVVVVRVVEVKTNLHSTWHNVIAFLDTVCR